MKEKPTQKDSFAEIETKQRKERMKLSQKVNMRKVKSKEDKEKAAQWAQKQVQEKEKEERMQHERELRYKREKKQAEQDYEAFRTRKEEEKKRQDALQLKRKKEREQKKEYLREISDRNRWNVLNEKKERDAKETKEKMKKEAEIEAKRDKLLVGNSTKQKRRALEAEYKKEFSKADIFERDHIEQVRKDTRKMQAKIKQKERAEIGMLRSNVAPADKERIAKKYIKMEHDAEVEANAKILSIKKEAKSMRDSVTQQHKKALQNLDFEKKQALGTVAEKRSQKRSEAIQTEKDMLNTQIPLPSAEKEDNVMR